LPCKRGGVQFVNNQLQIMNSNSQNVTTRREFLKNSSAIAVGAIAAPAILTNQTRAAEKSDTLRVGLIGCGGRGTGAAKNALTADKNVVLVAMGDVFEDHLQTSLKGLKAEFPDRVKVDPEHCFVGLDAYKKVIDAVDVVLLTTPPGFRPAHLRAAVDAGKHIFTEKPMAVDGPGVRSVLESAAKAKEKNLSLVSGFCWRYSYGERAVYEQIQNGAVGDIQAIYATYNTSGSDKWGHWTRANCKSEMEYQLRRWYYYPWLSGDHLVEQAVHNADKIMWAMKDKPPVRAIGTGGQQVRIGNDIFIYDHFGIVYEWDDGARAFLFCRQQDNCSGGVTDTIYGTKGVCKILPGKSQEIKGAKNWHYEGERPDMYQVEHDELFSSIRKGKPINDGVWMAQSTMLAILGRMAAYTGQMISWDEAMNSEETLCPEKIEWENPPKNLSVAMPGKTKFV
jgi:myo-inositol 2-dehydrogenase / D-chiro-inositol 1-dehydrogenase